MSTPAPDILEEDFTLLGPPDPVAALASLEHTVPSYHTYYLAAGVLMAAVLLVLLWRQWRHRRARILAGEAAHATALRELAGWRELTDKQRYPEAVTAVSGTLRRYVEARFGLTAPKLTTEEFWERQRIQQRVPRAHEPFWEMFFGATDGIKYASLIPDSHEFTRLLEAAVNFVNAARRSRAVSC
jgi:hypothetical protein